MAAAGHSCRYAAAGLGCLSAAPVDHRTAVVLHLHQLVDHGPTGPGQFRPQRLHRRRRVQRCDHVEPVRMVALDRCRCGHCPEPGDCFPDWLAVFSFQDHRQLFRHGHPGAVGNCSLGDRRHARANRRVAWHDAQGIHRGRIELLDLGPAVLQQDGLVLCGAGLLAAGAVHLAQGGSQHEPNGTGGDRRG